MPYRYRNEKLELTQSFTDHNKKGQVLKEALNHALISLKLQGHDPQSFFGLEEGLGAQLINIK